MSHRAKHATPTTCTHWQAVPCREAVTDEIVAWLCPDCDEQLNERPGLAVPPECVLEPPRDFEAEHRENHHGHPAVFPLACRECAYEQNPSYREWEK